MAKLEDYELKANQKKQYLDDIICFFKEERDEEIGIIAAEIVLDFFLSTLGKNIYNKGVNDAHAFISDKLDDLYALEKR